MAIGHLIDTVDTFDTANLSNDLHAYADALLLLPNLGRLRQAFRDLIRYPNAGDLGTYVFGSSCRAWRTDADRDEEPLVEPEIPDVIDFLSEAFSIEAELPDLTKSAPASPRPRNYTSRTSSILTSSRLLMSLTNPSWERFVTLTMETQEFGSPSG